VADDRNHGVPEETKAYETPRHIALPRPKHRHNGARVAGPCNDRVAPVGAARRYGRNGAAASKY